MTSGQWIETDRLDPRHPAVDSGLRLIASMFPVARLGRLAGDAGSDIYGGSAAVLYYRDDDDRPDALVAWYGCVWDDVLRRQVVGWYCGQSAGDRIMAVECGRVQETAT